MIKFTIKKPDMIGKPTCFYIAPRPGGSRSITMTAAKKAWTYFAIACVALLGAVSYELFVFPNQFAPAGLNGICTMIQHMTGLSVGYLSLLINIPLAIWCYLEVSRPLALRSMIYVVTFSLALLILDHVDLSAIAYETENGTSKILGPLVAGINMGYSYSVLARASAYSGGIDFISAIIHKRNPNKSFFSMSFIINTCIAVASYFVYDHQMEPVILSILYAFASTTVGDRLMRNYRSAIRFEIVTDYAQEISEEIIQKIHHSATLIPGRGMFSGHETGILVCVVNKSQISQLASIIRKYPHSFAIMSQVSQVMGNFKSIDDHGKPVHELLDHGDGKTL